MLSLQPSWQKALGEIKAEAHHRLRSSKKASWDFGVVFITGHEGSSVADITAQLDRALGTQGKLVGVAVDSSSGQTMQGEQSRAHAGTKSGITVLAVQLPEGSTQKATPFFIDKKGLTGVSHTIMRLQSRVRVKGAMENATPRGWREYLGVNDQPRPKGILLFVDPVAGKYATQAVLDGLDIAFPEAAKFGCVCADLPPTISGISAAIGENGFRPLSPGVCGLILPADISLHTVVSPSSVRIGPELRLTLADGYLVKEINGESPAKALAEVSRGAGPLEQLLVERSGFLLGLEAPRQHSEKKVWDGAESWGTSERAQSYTSMMKQSASSDWLVRSIEPSANGTLVVRREDLKKVPRRVGPAWFRCQLHVLDLRWARKELQLMLQRYLSLRMFLQNLQAPFGALVCQCSTTVGSKESEESELGYMELSNVLGKDLPITGALTNGEVAPPGIYMGGLDGKRTTRQGHTVSMCLFSYEPTNKDEADK